MAVSFFKKTISIDYSGYLNKITDAEILEDEEEQDLNSDDSDIENNNEKNFPKKITEKFLKLDDKIKSVEIKEKIIVDQKKNDISYNIYEFFYKNLNKNFKINIKHPLSLVNPYSLTDEFNLQKILFNIKDELSNEINLNIFDEYGFLKKIENKELIGLENNKSNLIDLRNLEKNNVSSSINLFNFLKENEDKLENKSVLKENILKNDCFLENNCVLQNKFVLENDCVLENENNLENKCILENKISAENECVLENLVISNSKCFLEEKNLEKEKNSEKKSNDQMNNEKLTCDWLNYLELTYNNVEQPKTKWSHVEDKIKHNLKLDNLIEQGIPYFLRPNLWLRFSDASLMKNKCELKYDELCKKSSHLKNDYENQAIKILPENICFQNQNSKCNLSLKRILRIIKWLERNGLESISNNFNTLNLNLIVANFLLILEEEDAFWLILSIINEWKIVFTLDLICKTNNYELIKDYVKKHCNNLDEKFKKEEIDINLFINNWLVSLFASSLNKTETLFRLWDLYFYYGFVVIFQLAFGLILHSEKVLNEIENSADLINSLSNLPDNISSSEILIKIWKLGCSKLEHINQNNLFDKKIFSEKDVLKVALPNINLFNENKNGIKFIFKNNNFKNLTDLNDKLKYKNVRQTAILMELHEAIVAIGTHFQSNDKLFELNLDIDFNEFEKNLKSNKQEIKPLTKILKKKRARALIDFKRNDDDELGFRKNDIITILDQTDEHCWIGKLNDHKGWFPAKFVEVLNENHSEYNKFGNDKVTPFINDLIRGRLCSVFKCILNNGLRKAYFFSLHPWMIIETLSKNYMQFQQNKINSKLNLTKTFKLDDLENVLNPKELFFKSVIYINETHINEPMDVKMRSLVCIALNHKQLGDWFYIYCNEDKKLLKNYYHSSSYILTPVWKMINLELNLLAQFPFNLNPSAELINELQPVSLASGFRDILINHHLFSWDI